MTINIEMILATPTAVHDTASNDPVITVPTPSEVAEFFSGFDWDSPSSPIDLLEYIFNDDQNDEIDVNVSLSYCSHQSYHYYLFFVLLTTYCITLPPPSPAKSPLMRFSLSPTLSTQINTITGEMLLIP